MGPQFHQTRMGSKFYEHDFPELVKAMQRIADALEEKNRLSAEKKEA